MTPAEIGTGTLFLPPDLRRDTYRFLADTQCSVHSGYLHFCGYCRLADSARASITSIAGGEGCSFEACPFRISGQRRSRQVSPGPKSDLHHIRLTGTGLSLLVSHGSFKRVSH